MAYGHGRLYHGTSRRDAESIRASGWDLSRAVGRGELAGRAVYVTDDRWLAEGYAAGVVREDETDAAVLVLSADGALVAGTDPNYYSSAELMEIEERVGASLQDLVRAGNWKLLGRAVRLMGYDALRVGSVLAFYRPEMLRVTEIWEYDAERETSLPRANPSVRWRWERMLAAHTAFRGRGTLPGGRVP
jgi:hypothetical protein